MFLLWIICWLDVLLPPPLITDADDNDVVVLDDVDVDVYEELLELLLDGDVMLFEEDSDDDDKFESVVVAAVIERVVDEDESNDDGPIVLSTLDELVVMFIGA